MIVDVVIGGLLEWVEGHNDRLVVIHGAAPGADAMAGTWDGVVGVEVVPFPADWGRFGKGAGPIRNQQMLDEGHPEVVVAFHDDLAGAKGTKDMVTRALTAGLPVYLVSRLREVP